MYVKAACRDFQVNCPIKKISFCQTSQEYIRLALTPQKSVFK